MQKLGEIAEISTGFPFDGHKYTSIGIRVVRGENIGQGELHWEEKVDKRWNESTSALDNYWLYEGDIVMQMDGNVGKNIARIYTADPMLIAQRVACIRAKVKCSQDYIYGILRTKLFKNYIERCATGTSIKHISLQQISDFEFDFHLPEIQAKLGRIIADIDDKIRVNRQINDNLEAMAKQLYDYWFVQFDFPNEEGKPYKSSGGAMVWNDKLKREIPEGWYAENICKIANILSGGTPSKAVDEYWNNGTIPFFGPTDCNGSVFQIKTADHITQKGLEHCASSLFEEGIVIITARGSIGKLVIVGTPMAMNQSCYALQSKEGEYEYLYFLTTQLIDCLKAKGSGSVFKSIIASDIEHSTLCIATENVVSDFCKKVKPLFEKLKANTIEIAELTKQRDELLPLLMNGQASVNSD